MQTSVSFRNLEPSEHLKAYVSDKLNRFDKLLDNPAEAGVVLTVEKHRHIAEISITGDRLTINGKEETGDMYSAIDMASRQARETTQAQQAKNPRAPFHRQGPDPHHSRRALAADGGGFRPRGQDRKP